MLALTVIIFLLIGYIVYLIDKIEILKIKLHYYDKG
jgi:hypothetical protein